MASKKSSAMGASTQDLIDLASDPVELARVADAEAALNRREEAAARVKRWDAADPGGKPSEIRLAEGELAAAKAAMAAEEAEVSNKRGDHPPEPVKPESAGRPNQVPPRQRQTVQEDAILDKLEELGYDPLALPIPQAGKSGAKSKVKQALGKEGVWAGRTVFPKAWDRLRAEGRIRDQA